MAEDNTPRDDAPPAPTPEESKPAPKRKRRWPKVLLGFLVLIVLLVIFAPSIASTGLVRSMVLNNVNRDLAGRIEVADWSIGWNSGVTVNGLKIYDEQGGLIAQASLVRTELSLLKTIRSGFNDYALGRTEVDNLDLTNIYVDEKGTPNIAKLSKGRRKQPKPQSEPMKIAGDIHVNNMTGNVTAVTAPGVTQKLHINPSNLALVITGLNDPIKNDVQLSFSVEDSSKPGTTAGTGTIALTGEADLFDNDKLVLDSAKLKQNLKLSNVDLAAANAFLAMAGRKLSLAGLANGALDVNVQGLANTAADGQVAVARFVATGEDLKGGRFASELSLPIKVATLTDNTGGKVLRIDGKLTTDYGDVVVNADASQVALERLSKGQAPGRDGRITVSANFDKKIPQLVEGLRGLLQLQPDVKIESAHLFAQLESWLSADRMVNKGQVHVSDVAATNKTGRITLSPITATLDATYVPAEGRPVDVTQFRDVAVVLDSAFAQLNGATGKGGTLAQFNLTASGRLEQLQDELKQFADLGKLQLKGTWDLRAGTQGDLSKPDALVATTVQLGVKNLTLAGFGDYPPIVQPWLDLNATGNVRLADNALRAVTAAVVKLRSNNPDQPTVDLVAKGDLDLKTFTSSAFDVTVKALLGKARDEFAMVWPALNQLDGGTLSASAVGSYDGKTLTLSPERPTAVKLSGLSLRRDASPKSAVVLKDQALDATFAGVLNVSVDEIGGDVKALAIIAPQLLELKKTGGDLKLKLFTNTKKITGTGGVTVFADVKRLGDLVKAFGPPATGTPAGATTAGELTKGLLNGTLTFARGDRPVTQVVGDFTADVAVTTLKEPITDKLTFTLKADAPDDLTQELRASVDVKGNIVNASVTDAQLFLARQLADKTQTAFNGPFDLVKYAKVSVNVDRLEAIQPMLASFSAPVVAPTTPVKKKLITGDERISSAPQVDDEPGAADKPLAPLRVRSGKFVFNTTLAREASAMLLKDATVDLTRFAFDRGDGRYDAADRPIHFKLDGAIETSPGATASSSAPPLAAIQKIVVRELVGELDAGQLKLIKPITLTNLTGPSPTADGGIEMKGSLAPLFRLVEAFQGEKPGSAYPYAGDYVVSQNVATQGQAIRLVGTLTASKFQAFDPADLRRPTFSEDLLTLANDVAIDTLADTATLNNVDLNMKSTGTLGLKIAGGQLVDWTRQRKIARPLNLKLHADWAKAWALLKPMLDPETAETFKDLEVAGIMDRDFVVSGSYPATGFTKAGKPITLTTAQSLKFLSAKGGLAFERLYVSGFDARNLDLPVRLEKGIFKVDEGARAFDCNGGTVTLAGTEVDLRYSHPSDGSIAPRITISGKDRTIISKVAFNPALAGETIGKYVNPGFSGPNDARGRVTVTVVECRDVPVDWFTTSRPPERAGRKARKATASNGRAELTLQISEMQLDTPFILKALNIKGITGEVRNGRIIAENGVVTSDIPIVSGKETVMAWSGKVNLQSRQIINFNTAISKDLLASSLPFIRNNAKFLPAVVNVPVSGSFDAPKMDLVAAVTSYVPGLGGLGSGKPGDLGKGIGDLIGGFQKGKDDKKDDKRAKDNPRDPGASADDRSNVNDPPRPKDDPIGGLLDLAGSLAKPKDKDKDKDKPAPKGEDRISSDPPKTPKPAKRPKGNDDR